MMQNAPDKTDILYRIAARTAIVAAVFSLVVAAILLYDFHRRTMKDPFEHKAIKALRLALDERPDNKALLAEYRAMDEQVRTEFFRQRAFAAAGAALLSLGVVVMLLAAKSAATIRRKLPAPQPLAAKRDFDSQWKPIAMGGVALLAVLLAWASLFIAWVSPRWMPQEEAVQEQVPAPGARPGLATGEGPTLPVRKKEEAVSERTRPSRREGPEVPSERMGPRESPSERVHRPRPTAPAYVATDEEIRTAWPRFRGPDGSGISPYTDVPDAWDAPAGKNILWKTPVPLPGFNSPIVCGSRVFVSGANENQRQVFCFDALSGDLLWQQDAPATSASKKPVKLSGADFASSTMATDGRRVYAIFANGDLAAFDYDGNLVWSQSLGIPESFYGHAASLLVYKEMLLVPMDQGEARAGRSKLLALAAATGKTVWEKSRPVSNSWTTPIIIHAAGRDQVVTVSNPWVIAYDPKDGTELWRVGGLDGDVAPSPVFNGSVVLAAANDHYPLLVIRPDGRGDVTKTHVVWKWDDNIPELCSPVATEAAACLLTSDGMVTCYDVRTGDKRWETDLGDLVKAPGKDTGSFHAESSPSLVGNRLYVIGKNGKGLILELGKEGCEKVGATDLGEPCVSSPAFQSGRIYLRGKKNLFCIAK